MYNTIDHPYNHNSELYNRLFHPLHEDKVILSIITNIFLSVITLGLWLIPFAIINRLDDRQLTIWKEGQASRVQNVANPILNQDNKQENQTLKDSLPETPSPAAPANDNPSSQMKTTDLSETSDVAPILQVPDANLPPLLDPEPQLFKTSNIQSIPDLRNGSAKEATQVINLIEDLKKLAESQKTDSITLSDGKSYSVPKKNDYSVTTWQLECNGRKYEINEHEEGAYNGVKREGFIKRQELIKSAAEKFIKRESLLNGPEILEAIKKLDMNFIKTIYKEEFWLDTKIMRQGYSANEAEIKTVTEYYSDKHKKCLELIAQFAKDVQHLISESLPKGSKLGFNLDDLDKMERECVLERNRPTIINTFFYQKRKFINMQRPESLNTIPSTIRDRKGLANYVTTSFGEIKNGEVIITSQTVRHSSYPPIAIENKYLRQAYAVQNFKQGLADYVTKLLETRSEPNTEDKPIFVSWRTMMLFTPKCADKKVRNRSFNGEWKGESEIDQFGESLLPLRMFDGRTILLQIEKKTVWVKLETSCMNLGANPEAAGKGAGSVAPSIKKEGLVNARGFIEFLNDVELLLEKLDLPQGILNDSEKELCGNKKEHLSAIKELNSVLSKNQQELTKEYMALEENYAEYVNEHEKNNRKDLEKNLSQADMGKKENPKLKHWEKKIAQSQTDTRKKDNPALKELEKKINQSRKEIRKNERTILEKYEKLKEIKRGIFKSIDGKQIQQDVNAKFELAIEKAKEDKNEQEREKLTFARDIQQNLYQAKKLFYGDGYRKPKKVMDLQTIYIQTYTKMKLFIEFFCKSGEDRTGRVDDKVQERELFYAIHNRMPSSDSDFEEINKSIAPLIHQYSVSQNNTEQNSNARGKQIGKAVNTLLPASIDDLHGKLAKEVFVHAKNLAPSDFVKDLVKPILISRSK